MKNVLRKWIAALLLISLLSGSAWAQGRIATVDLRKVFDNYWKKKEAEAQLKDRQADMEKEDKNMLDDYKKMKDEYQSLVNSANDQAVSSEERDKRKKSAEDKLKQMKELEDTITQYERGARTRIGEQSQRMRSGILGDIRNVVSGKAKAGGFSLVIDTAAESINATPIVLYTNNENDLTDAVLLQLNATAPTETSKADDQPADKKDEKKKDGKK
jgi:outer membrane protein